MDVTKKHVEFRNLEYNFMVDNGYLLFEKVDMGPDQSMIDMIFKSITDNLMSKAQNVKKINAGSWPDLTSDPDSVIIGIARDDFTESFRPGQHHAVNHLIRHHRITEITQVKNIKSYVLNMKKNQFAFFHPFQLHGQLEENQNIEWFVVESELTHDNNDSISMWRSWDVLKRNIEFTPLDGFNEQSFTDSLNLSTGWTYLILNKIWNDLNHIESHGIGQLIELSSKQLVLRIRPSDDNKNSKVFIKLGQPSIYESMIEIVYHMNHGSDDDKFEVRTIGVLSRACNVLFSRELTRVCTSFDNTFYLDIEMIWKHLIHINYNDKILQWFPRVSGPVDEPDDNGLRLVFKKRHEIYVYKFDHIDIKFMPRVNMIESWFQELELKGGFILSNHESQGYMILGGDSTNVHSDTKSDMCVFKDRFKCLHWKKVKIYHYSNHDFISQIDYDALPSKYFCHTINEIINMAQNNRNHILCKIVDNM
jgi:hypothetical protein